MDYSSPLAIQIRRFGQRLGVLRPAVRLYRHMLRKNYEDRFHDELLRAIVPGATVWDVGANVGFYTNLFAEKVGSLGKVVAFEPSPTTFAVLQQQASGRPEIVLHNVALSDRSGHATFYVGRTDTAHGATDSLTRSANLEAHAVSVSTMRGDSPDLIPVPNVIKIDVEGYELEVLEGMSGILKEPSIRGIFIEMHFLEMTNRGLHDGPKRIVDALHAADFLIRWTDPSHIAAVRP